MQIYQSFTKFFPSVFKGIETSEDTRFPPPVMNLGLNFTMVSRSLPCFRKGKQYAHLIYTTAKRAISGRNGDKKKLKER